MAKLPDTFDLINFLLGLAWLIELDRQQIQRLWFVGKSGSTVEKILAQLRKDELITARSWSVRDEARGITAPQLARWSLTSAGHALIKANDQYPAKPGKLRQQRLIAHDARTTETIVRLIEIARPRGLSGLFIAHELRLDPKRTRPVCDALVVLQLGAFNRPNLVPWSKDPAIEDETRYRIAIEADNNTEPLEVLRGKGHTYRQLHEDREWRAWWHEQYGPLPLPLWVASTEARTQTIHAQWLRAWPYGTWIATSDEGLQRNELLSCRAGEVGPATIAFPAAQRPALPPPPPAIAAGGSDEQTPEPRPASPPYQVAGMANGSRTVLLRPAPQPRQRKIHVHIAGLCGGDNVAHFIGPLTIVFQDDRGQVISLHRYGGLDGTSFTVLQPPEHELYIRVPRAGVTTRVPNYPDICVFGIPWPLPKPRRPLLWDANAETVHERFVWARRRWSRVTRVERATAELSAWLAAWWAQELAQAALLARQPSHNLNLVMLRWGLLAPLIVLYLLEISLLVGPALLTLGQIVGLVRAGRGISWGLSTVWRCIKRNPYRHGLRRMAWLLVCCAAVWALLYAAG